ncbi:MAG: hypothetical protein GXW85_08460 [Clostridia bacterium]|nr:hypothetical protein [Clostridia bacterium]
MARIKIVDIPKDLKISKEEMKKVLGGAETWGGTKFCAETWGGTKNINQSAPNVLGGISALGENLSIK